MTVKVLALAWTCLLLTIPCSADTIYVNADGSGDYPTIQSAISAPAIIDGDIIILADGTYTGPGNRDIDFEGKAITLQCEKGVQNCIIDCGGTESENHRGFWFHNGEDKYSVINSITITNGYAEEGGGIKVENGSGPRIIGCFFISNFAFAGGGIYNDANCCPEIISCLFEYNADGGIWNEHADPLIWNCTFRNNTAGLGGGISNNESNPTVNGCTFVENQSFYEGAGMSNFYSNPTVKLCTFKDNQAQTGGGGMFNYFSSPILTICKFIGNSAEIGGGIYNGVLSSPTIANCKFIGNIANRGGGMDNWAASPVLNDCLFTGNLANGYRVLTDYLGWYKIPGEGGGINSSDSTPVLKNCTFAGNRAQNGSSLSCDSYYQFYPSTVELINCILWNEGDEIFNNDGSTITITYSDIEGGWPGEGNIDADPYFVDSGYRDPSGTPDDPNDDFWIDGDYHLDWISPCVNAGDPYTNYTYQAQDMDSGSRIKYGRVDIGADEVYSLGCDFDSDEDVDLVDFAVYAKEQRATNYQSSDKLIASDGGNNFGEAVSISDNVCIVGAPGDIDNGINSGSAYIFRFDGTQWIEEQKLLPFDGEAWDLYGVSVSIDGNVCVIGSCYDGDNGYESGSAYIFRYDGTEWDLEQKLLASDGSAVDIFGQAVSISGDFCVVAARGDDDNGDWSGAIYIFKFDGSQWIQEQKILAFDGEPWDMFGSSVSINGDVFIVGADAEDDGGTDSGSAYIYRFDGNKWNYEAKIRASDAVGYEEFGISACINGDICVIGTFKDPDNGLISGAAYIFRYDGINWVQEQKLLPHCRPDLNHFGNSVSIEGDACIVGALGGGCASTKESGAATIFRFDGSQWIQDQELLSPDAAENDWFGSSVSVRDGNLIIGAPIQKAAYIFQTCPKSDFNGDCSTNLADLLIFARYWLTFGYETRLDVDLQMNSLWMYQNLPGQSNSNLIADVLITDDPMGNSSYTYEWGILLPNDVTVAPTITGGGGLSDPCYTFAAPSCNEADGLSDSGQAFTVLVTVIGNDYGNTGTASVQFGIALLGDVNNDTVVNVIDRIIIDEFWRTGSAGSYTLRDCNVDSDAAGVVNVIDKIIANEVWRGNLGSGSVSSPCPFR